MTRDEAREYIRSHATDYLQPDRCGKGWICPACHSGEGNNHAIPENGDGMKQTDDGLRFTCWRCQHGQSVPRPVDIIDIIGYERAGIPVGDRSRFGEALDLAIEAFGLTVDGKAAQKPRRLKPAPAVPKPHPDFTDEFARFPRIADSPAAVEYLTGRGLSINLAERLGLRFIPWYGDCGAIAIPFFRLRGYTRKPIDGGKAMGRKGGAAHMFNAEVLAGPDPVFVCEGWADALSVMEAGGTALSLNGKHGKYLREAVESLKGHGSAVAPLVLLLDGDSAGLGAAQTLHRMLSGSGGLGVYSLLLSKAEAEDLYWLKDGENGPEPAKDANEALLANRERLAGKVAALAERAKREAAIYVPPAEPGAASQSEDVPPPGDEDAPDSEYTDPDEHADMMLSLTLEDLLQTRARFVDAVKSGKFRAIPTGIDAIDTLLGGGLVPGVTMVGARTGKGKTTLALQIADSIGAAGRPVLYAALEMTAEQLAAKSIARAVNEARPDRAGLKSYDVLTGHIPDDMRADVKDATDEYFAWAEDRMFVYDVLKRPTAERLVQMARSIEDKKGAPPLVVVDYLQIMRPPDGKDMLTEKQIADRSMDSLNLMAAGRGVPVLAVSSLNRAAYSGKGDLPDPDSEKWYDILESAFKESGGIEYTATAACALWSFGGDTNLHGEYETNMRLYLLKNRWGEGRKSARCVFKGARGMFGFDIWYCRDDEEPYSGYNPFCNNAPTA